MEENHNTALPKRTSGAKILKGVMWFAITLLGIIACLSALLFVYEDEVKAAIISELNKHLKAEVKIDPKNIDLTIIKTFPDCSIQFKKVLILEALPVKQRDTLLFAGQLNLLFNINNLWSKKYAVHKIKVKDGVLKPAVSENGKNNYTIWQSNDTIEANGQKLDFNLELLTLERCRLNYNNKQASVGAAIQIKNLSFKGNFKALDFEMSAEGQFIIDRISNRGTDLLVKKDMEFLTEISVSKNKYSINKAMLSLNRLQIDLKGGFSYTDRFTDLNLTYNAPNLDIAALLSLLPDTYKNKINDYSSSGNFYARGQLLYRSQNDFMLESDFGINKGNITYQPQSTSIQHVNVEGYLKYSNNASLLQIKNIYLKLNNDELSAKGTIRNFADPYISLSASAGCNLANLQSFWPIDTLTRLQGSLKIDADVEGLLSDLRQQTFSSKVRLDVNASVSNLEAQFKNDADIFAVQSGSVIAMNRELEVRNLKLKRGSSDLVLNGKLPGFFNYLSGNAAALVVTGHLSSNYLKMEDFMLKYKASGGETDLIPANVSCRLNADIGRFSYADFSATKIAGEIEIKDQKAIVSDMTMQALGGTAGIDAYFHNTNHKLNVVLQSQLKGINVTQLFSSFNNFGQVTLQDKNIKGFLSADIDFSGTWNNQLEADLNTISATCDLNIEKGELIDFKPLVSLSKFVDIEDLKHIKFSTLQSEVLINRQTITFPKTVLMNSALNIVFSGTHTFDNIIDYHIQLVISELMAKHRKADDEFGPIEEDKEKRRNAFILMTGPLDNPKKKFDRKGQKEKIKEDWKQEKQTVKQIFRDEFGSKKNDSPPKEKRTEQKFELEKPNNNPPKKTLEPKKKPTEEDF